MTDPNLTAVWQRAGQHLQRLAREPAYRVQIEKQLYAGAPAALRAEIQRSGPAPRPLQGEIRPLDFAGEPELAAMQRLASALATEKTAALLAAYDRHPATGGGRYVCSDSFKELFPAWAEPAQRARANDALHNSSAVLAATQLAALLERSEPRLALFLTGIPGAGKTTLSRALLDDERVGLMFEGQLARPQSAFPKITACLDRGWSVAILAVHRSPETALANTLKRFHAYGRGSSLAVMSAIQGNLPAGLAELHAHFGGRIRLLALDGDAGDFIDDPAALEARLNLGAPETIRRRLEARLDALWQSGALSPAARAQALHTHLKL